MNGLADLRVLTVRQPWASAIASGAKLVENRTRSTSYRGAVAIHAGLQDDKTAGDNEHVRWWAAHRPSLERATALPRGVVIAVTYLVGCHRADGLECHCTSPWAQTGDVYHWTLAGTRRLEESIPWRGALGLRSAPELLQQLRELES